MSVNEKIKELARSLHSQACDIRNYLHENPELSDQEFETSKYLKEECKKLGFLIEEAEGSTGFTALLDTGREGKTLGIRTDIDALPILEDKSNGKNEKASVSKVDGIMHACGHDFHMATLITSGKILKELKDEISGKVYLIFEEGEETGGGIQRMLKHLKDKNLDAVYGNHIDTDLPTGKISIKKGPVQAGCAGVDFDVLGKGGHGSRPDLCISPLTATVNIVNALQTAWNNRIDQNQKVTLGIGSINGGFASNVIPDECNVKATIRFFEEESGQKALDILKEVVEATAKAHGCQVKFNDYTRVVAIPNINDDQLAEFAQNSLNDLFDDAYLEKEESFGSESFSYYGKLAPTVFSRIGIANENLGSGQGAHTPKFDVDLEALYYSVSLASKFAVDYLSNDK